MSDPDRLAAIRMRRAAVPDPPYEIRDTVTEEEFYMRWRLIEYGPPDEHGRRDWWAGIPEGGGADLASFVANAPADIDWLVAELDRLRALLAPTVDMTSPHRVDLGNEEGPPSRS